MSSHAAQPAVLGRKPLHLARNIPLVTPNPLVGIKQPGGVIPPLYPVEPLILLKPIKTLLEVRLADVALAGVAPGPGGGVPDDGHPAGRHVRAVGRDVREAGAGVPEAAREQVQRGGPPGRVDGVVWDVEVVEVVGSAVVALGGRWPGVACYAVAYVLPAYFVVPSYGCGCGVELGRVD